MTTLVEGDWFAVQRQRKAARIAEAARVSGVTADQVAHLDRRGRLRLEKAAATRKGSDETWRLVLSMLAGSVAPNARCPFCGHGDPLGTWGEPKNFGHDGPCSR